MSYQQPYSAPYDAPAPPLGSATLNPALYPANVNTANRASRRARNAAAHKRAETQSAQASVGVTQPSLLLAASRQEERFQAFMRAHPDVYREFKRRALALHARGYRHFGAKAIAESIRYETALNAATVEEPFKLNNNHVSRLVRVLISEHPELGGFFSLRELRSA